MSSKLPAALSATDEEIQLLLAAQCHIGGKNCDKQMEPYVWKRRADGIHIINIGKTWEKLSSLPVSSPLLKTQMTFV